MDDTRNLPLCFEAFETGGTDIRVTPIWIFFQNHKGSGEWDITQVADLAKCIRNAQGGFAVNGALEHTQGCPDLVSQNLILLRCLLRIEVASQACAHFMDQGKRFFPGHSASLIAH
jgi:hypothetical protein